MIKVLFRNKEWQKIINNNQLNDKTLANYYLNKTSKDVSLLTLEIDYIITELYKDLLYYKILSACKVFDNGHIDINLGDLNVDDFCIKRVNKASKYKMIVLEDKKVIGEHYVAPHRIPKIKTSFNDINNSTGNIVFEIIYFLEKKLNQK